MIESYLREHWSALDGLSGDWCDVYPSLMQLRGDEDAYTQLNELKDIPGIEGLNVNSLPLIILWSNDAHSVFTLKGMSHDELVIFFRYVFSRLATIRRGIRQEDGLALQLEIQKMARKIDSQQASTLHALAPILWTIPALLILPVMAYTFSNAGVSGSIIVFFFLLLLYGLIGALALKAQGKLREKAFLEVLTLVYSSSLAGLKELLSKLTDKRQSSRGK